MVMAPVVAGLKLSGESFVLLHRRSSPWLYDEVLALCRRAGKFSPHVVSEADHVSTVLLLVESGIGVSILPAVYVTWSVQVDWCYFAGCSPLPRNSS
jgi:DNA-binding transcriptional LysR family regulator